MVSSAVWRSEIAGKGGPFARVREVREYFHLPSRAIIVMAKETGNTVHSSGNYYMGYTHRAHDGRLPMEQIVTIWSSAAV